MNRVRLIAAGVGSSLTLDSLVWYFVWREARIKDNTPSGYWWLLTITIAVVAIIPLFEMARRGHLAERILAGLFCLLPLGWIGICAYVAFNF